MWFRPVSEEESTIGTGTVSERPRGVLRPNITSGYLCGKWGLARGAID
jgi:hypothetical protein